MKYLIGIDIGTSGTKTVLFDTTGKALKSKTVGYPMNQPHNGWAEQNPEDWWNAVTEGLRCVLGDADASEVAGVGLSGQMHGLVMLDKDCRVLRPSIIWCDQRSAAECGEIANLLGNKRVTEITANPPMTGFTASKILWVRNNEPEIYARCAKILLPKDYIRHKLCGEFATEVSDASGMQLMDIAKRSWSDEVLSKLSIDKTLLPELHESPDVTGRVHKSASGQTGLIIGTPVAGGAGDNAAAAIGSGIVREGNAFTTVGSSAVVYALSDTIRIDPLGRIHSLCASVPGKWTVMSCTQAAGLSLKWLRDICCVSGIAEYKKPTTDIYSLMDAMAEKIPVGAEKLLFLPYLMGERSPHPDPDARGVFFGISAIHNRSHLIRAVMEGVAYSQRECVDVFRDMGINVDDMTIVGGGARSELWRQMLADNYRCPVRTLKEDEGAALGAALLAGTGSGIYSSVEQAADAVVKKNPPQMPDEQSAITYEPYFALYKKLYRSLFDDFKSLAAI